MKIAYTEPNDADFIRWTSNLLRTFIENGEIIIANDGDRPDVLLASIWRKHKFPAGVPVILVSNENWQLFQPHAPLRKYHAVLGLYEPPEPCTFIQFPYAAVHFDVAVEELYTLRAELMATEKTEFCCFVASNTMGDLAKERMALFGRINQWQRVDSGGAILNNLGYRVPRGLEFLRWIAKYKYMICIENSLQPSYITEKPYQAWFAGTVPIYNGGHVGHLNPHAIVNASSPHVLTELQRIEASPELYESKRRASLTDSPLSLGSFVQQFRALVLDPGRPKAVLAEAPTRPHVSFARRLASLIRQRR